MTQGYASDDYATSFVDFGDPLTLPASGAHVLRRVISGRWYDFTGIYPFVRASEWSALPGDLERLRGDGAVSAVFVTDPFAEEATAALNGKVEILRRYKCHYIVDLSRDWRKTLRKTTRQYAHRALDSGSFRMRPARAKDIEVFWPLYEGMIVRHNMTGLQALSRASVERQLRVPGAMVAEMESDGEITCQMILYVDGSTLYPHLVGTSGAGYANFANYGMILSVLEWADDAGLHQVTLGGVAGLKHDARDGLAVFKRGFANDTRWTYLAGKVLDQAGYASVSSNSTGAASFFPTYRLPSPLAARG